MGAAQSTLNNIWYFATLGPRYAIWFWSSVFELPKLFKDGVPYEKWPNEVKFVVLVASASVLGLILLGLSPFLEIPEVIIQYVYYLQFDFFKDAFVFLEDSFYSFSKFFGASESLINLVFYSFSTYVGITLIEEIINYFLLSRLNDDEYMRVFHFLCEPLTYFLHFLDPAYFTKRESKFPYLSYLYDWFCTILVFPWQLLAMIATPLVTLVYVPEDEWVDGEVTFWTRLTSLFGKE